MNLASRSKKRVVLPSRPDPPTVDHILEDVNRAGPNDPVFSILEKSGPGEWLTVTDHIRSASTMLHDP